eukprot:CAMPEP_0168314900 /NCGR_PEP_ID=MMETSP0210-20121227/9683_1 /TAXON_ID=40633 /ORGANISM="Condylostoma magnum, Strain COL2" /LENGTH=43 /DNA_ID= /DNA_START= /DNA_END= /DNA_ORIENTATION=
MTNGYPSGTPFTLLDQGHMTDLLEFGADKDWHGISSLFGLNST